MFKVAENIRHRISGYSAMSEVCHLGGSRQDILNLAVNDGLAAQ